MVQNVYAAGAKRDPSAFNIHLRKAENGTIIGKRPPIKDREDLHTKPKEGTEEPPKVETSDEGDIQESDHRHTIHMGEEVEGTSWMH